MKHSFNVMDNNGLWHYYKAITTSTLHRLIRYSVNQGYTMYAWIDANK